MCKVMPKIIQEVGFDFRWDNKKVWSLSYPVEDVDISLIDWHFEIPFWNTGKSYYDLKPIDVINFPDDNKEEYNRTMNADTSHPIDIMENKGRWLILDGLHRLVKLKILGKTKIKVRKIPRSEISNIAKVQVLKGKVKTGLGNFSYWIEKLQDHYYKKTGMKFFPGTLNVEIDSDYSLPKDKILRLEKEEYGGSASINMVPCEFNGLNAFILRTDSNEAGKGRHPKNIVEIACDVKLRDKFNLKDDCVVEILVFK